MIRTTKAMSIKASKLEKDGTPIVFDTFVNVPNFKKKTTEKAIAKASANEDGIAYYGNTAYPVYVKVSMADTFFFAHAKVEEIRTATNEEINADEETADEETADEETADEDEGD